MPKILVVDDDNALRSAITRLLVADGHEVIQAADGVACEHALRHERFDAVLADLCLPPLTDLDIIKIVRQHDPAVPIVVMTGMPTMTTAIGSLEFGVYRYLTKPFDPARMRDIVGRASRLHALSRWTERAAKLDTNGIDVDRVDIESQFRHALDTVWLAVQPIVDVRTGCPIAYEALLRSDAEHLGRPDDLLRVAFELGRFPDLARVIRWRASTLAHSLPLDCSLYVNLHPTELMDDLLLDIGGLAANADRIVLEITERASLSDVHDLASRIASLRRAGFRLAIDDLGTGYSGLSSMTQLEPDVVKLDMSLVRDVTDSLMKRTVIRAMTDLCSMLDLALVAEGVETIREKQTLQELGVQLMQGYYFSRPLRGFPITRPVVRQLAV